MKKDAKRRRGQNVKSMIDSRMKLNDFEKLNLANSTSVDFDSMKAGWCRLDGAGWMVQAAWCRLDGGS